MAGAPNTRSQVKAGALAGSRERPGPAQARHQDNREPERARPHRRVTRAKSK
ncbi:hypothetical protein ACN28S_03155 [Cystobacter fuscus]